MAVTPQNFCHVEEIAGAKVLFFIEHEGESMVLHQIAHCSVGTIDIKVEMPADNWDEMWPDKIRFTDAAAMVARSIRELGLTFGTTGTEG